MAEKKKTRRTDEELLQALERMEALEETAAMTDEQIEAEIRAKGGDPDAIGRRGVELVKKLAGEGLEGGDGVPQRMAAGVSREQLEKRLAERAKDEPTIAQALAGREPKDLTLEELVALLRK
jgi:hypothetical protein